MNVPVESVHGEVSDAEILRSELLAVALLYPVVDQRERGIGQHAGDDVLDRPRRTHEEEADAANDVAPDCRLPHAAEDAGRLASEKVSAGAVDDGRLGEGLSNPVRAFERPVDQWAVES